VGLSVGDPSVSTGFVGSAGDPDGLPVELGDPGVGEAEATIVGCTTPGKFAREEPPPPLHPHSNTNTEESINISSILSPFTIALVLAVQVAQVTPTGIRQSFYWSYKQHKIRAGIPRRNSLRRIYRSSPDKSKTGFAA
jgi:hypothetical protein